MRWTAGGKSSDLEDRRGFGGGARIGIGGALVLLVLSLLFRRDFFSLVGVDPGATGATGAPGGAVASTPREDSLVQFVSFVLDDAQNTWTEAMEQRGQEYQRAKLVLFRDAVQSACGYAQAAMGPFYCPVDQKVYLDYELLPGAPTRDSAPQATSRRRTSSPTRSGTTCKRWWASLGGFKPRRCCGSASMSGLPMRSP